MVRFISMGQRLSRLLRHVALHERLRGVLAVLMKHLFPKIKVGTLFSDAMANATLDEVVAPLLPRDLRAPPERLRAHVHLHKLSSSYGHSALQLLTERVMHEIPRQKRATAVVNPFVSKVSSWTRGSEEFSISQRGQDFRSCAPSVALGDSEISGNWRPGIIRLLFDHTQVIGEDPTRYALIELWKPLSDELAIEDPFREFLVGGRLYHASFSQLVIVPVTSIRCHCAIAKLDKGEIEGIDMETVYTKPLDRVMRSPLMRYERTDRSHYSHRLRLLYSSAHFVSFHVCMAVRHIESGVVLLGSFYPINPSDSRRHSRRAFPIPPHDTIYMFFRALVIHVPKNLILGQVVIYIFSDDIKILWFLHIFALFSAAQCE